MLTLEDWRLSPNAGCDDHDIECMLIYGFNETGLLYLFISLLKLSRWTERRQSNIDRIGCTINDKIQLCVGKCVSWLRQVFSFRVYWCILLHLIVVIRCWMLKDRNTSSMEFSNCTNSTKIRHATSDVWSTYSFIISDIEKLCVIQLNILQWILLTISTDFILKATMGQFYINQR